MKITVNGEPREVPENATAEDLVRILGLEKAACAVEVNTKLVPKKRRPEHRLADGDRVEVVSLVGGG
jgi:sulfur carrier protein